MSNFKKHVGRIRNTDRRCVVVFMQIQGKEDHALIVDTDALPDRFHDALMDIVDSVEGQNTTHLYTLLSRRILPDTGVDMLNALYGYGLLRPVPIDNIVMYPSPNNPCPLRTIVDFMNGQTTPTVESANLDNRILENQKAEKVQEQVAMAKNILAQAADLEAEANRKREQAYRLAPSLRPDNGVNTFAPAAAAPVVEQALEAPVAPVQVQEAVSPVTATPIIPEAPQAPMAFVDDSGDLDPEMAKILQEAQNQLAQGPQFIPETEVSDEAEETEAAHGIDPTDDRLQEFLARAAAREDAENKAAIEAQQPKRPVGRPRKDGSPAGSPRA